MTATDEAETITSETTVFATADSLESEMEPRRPEEPPVVLDVAPLDVRVEQRYGYRLLRGKPAKVATQHLNILIDGRMHAWTLRKPGTDIFAIAEFVEEEIPQVQAAVQSYTKENEPRPFRPNTAPTQAEIEKLKQA
ncbi:hypothetical protein [Allorhodopirellula heiligendammensis]|uniref:Uncharacterized protein n=1 Tax=Allorhodopirellula heiligendammensis TaxID=2714739 RepID=A0A5C6C8C0_9BACT|nr:hypothetical protein [Allorhodopirellula heiligendammensis]TWU19564.1 hypothetical protein Poly21_17380 [Allorhodopirellula heiligendammensis]